MPIQEAEEYLYKKITADSVVDKHFMVQKIFNRINEERIAALQNVTQAIETLPVVSEDTSYRMPEVIYSFEDELNNTEDAETLRRAMMKNAEQSFFRTIMALNLSFKERINTVAHASAPIKSIFLNFYARVKNQCR